MTPEQKEKVRAAMSILGSMNTEEQTEARRQNAAKATASNIGKPKSPEQKAKMRQAQKERREQERAAAPPPAPKRPRGRPPRTVVPETGADTE